MLLINRIKNFEHYSNSEHQIAQYIVDHTKEITDMTIHALADKTFTSASTITRFCRKLGVDGFSDLKLQLAREMSAASIQEGRIQDELPFEKNQTAEEITNRILNLNIQSMNDTYQQLDIVHLEKVSRMLYEAPHIYLYGTGQSLILAQDFQYKLFRINRDCNLETAVGFQFMKVHTQPLDSIALMISYYGNGLNNLRIIKDLSERGIKVILITGPNENPLCQYAAEVIHVAPQEELITKMASFSSRTAIQLVLDFIYSLIFSFDYEDNQKRLSTSTLLR